MSEVNFKDPHVVIADVPYPMKFGFRSYAIYNDRGNTNEDLQSPTKKTSALIELYYSGIVAGCERNKVPALTKDEFLDALDDQPGLFEEINESYQESTKVKK